MKCVVIFPSRSLLFFIFFFTPTQTEPLTVSRTLSTAMEREINPPLPHTLPLEIHRRTQEHTHPQGYGPRSLVREPISTVITLRSHFRKRETGGGQSVSVPGVPSNTPLHIPTPLTHKLRLFFPPVAANWKWGNKITNYGAKMPH